MENTQEKNLKIVLKKPESNLYFSTIESCQCLTGWLTAMNKLCLGWLSQAIIIVI